MHAAAAVVIRVHSEQLGLHWSTGGPDAGEASVQWVSAWQACVLGVGRLKCSPDTVSDVPLQWSEQASQVLCVWKYFRQTSCRNKQLQLPFIHQLCHFIPSHPEFVSTPTPNVFKAREALGLSPTGRCSGSALQYKLEAGLAPSVLGHCPPSEPSSPTTSPRCLMSLKPRVLGKLKSVFT